MLVATDDEEGEVGTCVKGFRRRVKLTGYYFSPSLSSVSKGTPDPSTSK